MASVDEMPEFEPLNKREEGEEEEEREEDPVVEVEAVKDDDLIRVEDFIDETKGNTPAYSANVPMEMKSIIHKLI